MAIRYYEILENILETNIDFLADQNGMTVDEIYDRIVTEAQRNKSEWYSGKAPALNYDQPVCRLAYLAIIAASNAATVRQIIAENDDLRSYILRTAKERGAINICAFGAGPGTELLAMAKFFEDNPVEHTVAVDFQLLDKVKEWNNSWQGIRNEINNSFSNSCGSNRANWPVIPSGSLLECDVTELEQMSTLSNVWGQDLYILNFLLSEVFELDGGFAAFMTEVARYAPIGAKFLIIDRHCMWIDKMRLLVNEAGLALSPCFEAQGSLSGLREFPRGTVYSALRDRGWQPRRGWKVGYAIATKEL